MKNFRNVFALDLRSLAAFRVGLGFFVVLDVLMRARDLTAHYSNDGVLPVGPYVEHFANRLHISLHLANGNPGWTAVLFAIELAAGLALLAGYRTRLASIVAWVLLVSTHNRNPLILNGGDVLFRMLLFWSIFLPLGARFSVDHALSSPSANKSNRFFSGPSIALTLQVVFIYASTVVLKSGREWWPDGTASYYALALDQFTTSFGVWMSQWYELLRICTYLVFGLEVAAPVLLLFPWRFALIRTVTLFALMLMHLNFDLTMRLGIFPWIDILALVALLPTEFCDYVGRRVLPSRAADLKIYYDQECAVCHKLVLLLKEFLLGSRVSLIPAAEDPRVASIVASEKSWVVEDSAGVQHRRYAGFLALIEAAPLVGALAKLIPLRRLQVPGDWAYRFIEGRRRALSHLTSVALPYSKDLRIESSRLTNLLAIFFIIYVGAWNLKTIPSLQFSIDHPWNMLAPVLRLDQKWNMFAPYPLKDDGWFVIDGELVDGTKVDVMTNREGQVSYDKPALVSGQHANARWRKYMMEIVNKSKQRHRLYFGKYLCRRWNAKVPGERRLSHFELVFMKERTVPYGGEQSVKRVSLWQHNCLKQ